MIKFIFFKIFGWKINGKNNFTKKCIVIVVPHTHWLDFFLGIIIRYTIWFLLNPKDRFTASKLGLRTKIYAISNSHKFSENHWL